MAKQEETGRRNNPESIEDYQHNVQFQLSNVEGWVYVKDYDCALIKAQCLVEELKALKEFSNDKK